jgi:hypothetical protein
LSALERIHLRGIGPLFVFVVERSADSIPDQPTKHTANRRPGQSITGSATCNRCAEYRASSRTEQSPGVFFRSWAHPIRASGAGSEHQAGDGNSGKPGNGHFDPREKDD